MKAIARIWARRIHDGAYTLTDVPEKYVTLVKSAYVELFGEELA
ncbi:MAG: hypothetical protein SPL40_02045 [Erysipelotrichaceae bacterium]|nr:hypothetical protein [Erysipelotrichaceae bacterium]